MDVSTAISWGGGGERRLPRRRTKSRTKPTARTTAVVPAATPIPAPAPGERPREVFGSAYVTAEDVGEAGVEAFAGSVGKGKGVPVDVWDEVCDLDLVVEAELEVAVGVSRVIGSVETARLA